SAEALEMVDETLRGMAHGGMHDHLGGGFHRYSVDERWFVPHFEKMLYDQAQLAIAYLEAFQISHHPFLSEVARGIFEYVLRDMTDPSGGFFSAEDADSARPENPSEHGEGAFYVWTKAEIDSALGPDAIPFCLRYGIEDNGNVAQDPQAEFTGRNILYLARTLTEVTARTDIETLDEPLTRAKQKLFDIRSARPRPHLDNKILTAWNALMISALVKGYSVLRETRYLDAAERAASFLLSALYDRPAKRLLRRFCDGDAAVSAFLDDYAFLAQALLDLFEATGKAEYLERSVAFANAILEKFEDPQNGGFFSTEAVSDDLLLRIKDDYDGAEPSGNSVATDVLLRLAHLSGNGAFRTSAEKSLRAFAAKLRAQPTIAPQMLVAAGRMLSAPRQIVIRCAEMSAEVHDLLAPYQHDFQPWSVVLALTDEAALRLRDLAPFLASLERKGRITIYECHNFTCDLPKVIE
ncbi:MAG: thioredoxin domain-containing protein, partial [Acidobacteriaceae bacterium]|nr:thioredoxin domain-containing protein [Acidobacteriaceae bacterium]